MAGQAVAPVSSTGAGWRGKSLVEVLVVFVVAGVLARVRFMLTADHLSPLAQSYVSGINLFLIPVAILALTRRNWADYGFTLKNWRYNLDAGMTAYLVRMLGGGGIALLMFLGLSYRVLPGALILLGIGIVEIVIFGRVLQRRGEYDPPAMPNLAILAGLLVLPIAAALALGRLNGAIVSVVIWQFVFSGFGEEVYYRGYIQSRVNQEYGRPWSVFGIPFGPGLIVAALLFGLSHVINNFNPLMADYRLWWGWGLWTVAGGVLFGLIRERCGSLLAPGIAHGLLDAVAESFAVILGWSI